MPAPKDYGDLHPEAGRAIRRVFIGVGALILAGGAAMVVSDEMFQFQEDSRAWPKTGAPCPIIPPAAVAHTLATRGLAVRYRIAFEGAEFGRAFGNGDCGLAPSGVGWSYVPACRFDAPALVLVRTKHGETYFLPGLGRETLAFADAQGPRCYVAPIEGAAS